VIGVFCTAATHRRRCVPGDLGMHEEAARVWHDRGMPPAGRGRGAGGKHGERDMPMSTTALRRAAACACAAVVCAGWCARSVADDAGASDPALSFKTLHVFRPDVEGGNPRELIQASDGHLYGVTARGGVAGGGTLYRMRAGGGHAVEVLHQFGVAGGDGREPLAALVQASDGNFYGTTSSGGAAGLGTVYRCTSGGDCAVLHSFAGIPDGSQPWAPLVQASDGYLYGTTTHGGLGGAGTVFRIAPDGSGYLLLHEFQYLDGYASTAALLEGRDHLLYGTTPTGGPHGKGTLFSVTTAGGFTMLHSLTPDEGIGPRAALVQAGNGDFFGTASSGGPSGGGTVFRMSPGGHVSVVHAFPDSDADGWFPMAGLVDPGDGNLYGTTMSGPRSCPAAYCGVVYRIAPDGSETIVHAFTSSGYRNVPHTGLTRLDRRGLVGETQGYAELGGTIFTVFTAP
jgi:uncharacterized repeat protein (TIGR03803 family)